MMQRRMQIVVWVLLSSVLIHLPIVTVRAEDAKPQGSLSAGSVVSVADTIADSPASATTETTSARPQSAEEEIRVQLNGTEWTLELTAISPGEPLKTRQDTIQFDSAKVSSKRLMKEGYPSSNYTITIGDDGMVVWETMQTKENEGVVFWRGELHDSAMRGIVSKHPLEGNAEDFSFSGQRSNSNSAAGKHAVEKSAVQKQVQDQSSAIQSPTPSSEKPASKKRKGWFGR